MIPTRCSPEIVAWRGHVLFHNPGWLGFSEEYTEGPVQVWRFTDSHRTNPSEDMMLMECMTATEVKEWMT